MVQLILIGCFLLIAFGLIESAVSLVRFLRFGTGLRKLVAATSFCVGGLVVGWIVWRVAMPDDWTLTFWTTIKASVDSATYGHTTEHAAEVLASKAIILGTGGGLLTAVLSLFPFRRAKERH